LAKRKQTRTNQYRTNYRGWGEGSLTGRRLPKVPAKKKLYWRGQYGWQEHRSSRAAAARSKGDA